MLHLDEARLHLDEARWEAAKQTAQQRHLPPREVGYIYMREELKVAFFHVCEARFSFAPREITSREQESIGRIIDDLEKVLELLNKHEKWLGARDKLIR
jgi:hypothetical protein